jgi:hypothetical protein
MNTSDYKVKVGNPNVVIDRKSLLEEAKSLGIKELDLQLLKDNELERFVRLFKVEQALREGM